jgi:transcriptional regulator of NAD metabolism
MGLHSRADVQRFLTDISSGKSSLLKNITCGYHYHTIEAADVATLDRIAGELKSGGFLADLKEYEPAELTEQ